MRRRGPVGGAAALVLALPVLLGGCSSSPEEQYCGALTEAKPRLLALSRSSERSDGGAVVRALPVLEGVAAEAPVELRDEWQTVLSALQAFRQVARQAGLDLGPGAEQRLTSLDPAQRSAVEGAAARLVAPSVVAASAGIEDYSQQVCQVRLNL